MGDVIFSENNGTLVARLSSEIDHHSAKNMREKIDEMLFCKRPEILVLDFSLVRFMDSSGIGLILGRVEVAGMLGCHVRITALSELLMKIVRLSGIERVKNLSIG